MSTCFSSLQSLSISLLSAHLPFWYFQKESFHSLRIFRKCYTLTVVIPDFSTQCSHTQTSMSPPDPLYWTYFLLFPISIFGTCWVSNSPLCMLYLFFHLHTFPHAFNCIPRPGLKCYIHFPFDLFEFSSPSINFAKASPALHLTLLFLSSYHSMSLICNSQRQRPCHILLSTPDPMVCKLIGCISVPFYSHNNFTEWDQKDFLFLFIQF